MLTAHIRRYRYWLLLAVIIAAAATLRFYHLGNRSLWMDELAEVAVALRPIPDLLDGVRQHAAAAPLDYLGVKAAIAILGHGTAAARSWALLLGIATVAAAAWAGLEAWRSPRVALIAAALVALNPILISYSQEARFYAVGTLLTVSIFAAFSRAARRSGLADWTVFSALAAAGLYAYYFTGLAVLACGAALLVEGAMDGVLRRHGLTGARRWRRNLVGFAVASAAAGVAFLPWFFFGLQSQLATTFYGSGPDPLDANLVVQTVQYVLSPADSFATVPWLHVGLAAVICVIAAVGFVHSRPLSRPSIMAAAIFVVAAIPVIWLADSHGQYFYAFRQVFLAVPILLLLAASGLSYIAHRCCLVARRASTAQAVGICVALLFVANLPSLASVYAVTFRNDEDWRTAAFIIREAQCADSRGYVNLSQDDLYGVGYYQPELLARTSTVVNYPVVDALRDGRVRPHDWVLVAPLLSSVGGPAGRQALTDYLSGELSHPYLDLPGLRLFLPVSCSK